MVTHQLTWSGELARHAAFLAACEAPQATPAGGPPLMRCKDKAAQARARILAVLSDGHKHKHTEIVAAVGGLALSRINLTKQLRLLRDQGRIEAFGHTTNRWFQLL